MTMVLWFRWPRRLSFDKSSAFAMLPRAEGSFLGARLLFAGEHLTDGSCLAGGNVFRKILLLALLSACVLAAQTKNPARKLCTLTVQVESGNSQGGNIDVLLFNSTKGWP